MAFEGIPIVAAQDAQRSSQRSNGIMQFIANRDRISESKRQFDGQQKDRQSDALFKAMSFKGLSNDRRVSMMNQFMEINGIDAEVNPQSMDLVRETFNEMKSVFDSGGDLGAFDFILEDLEKNGDIRPKDFQKVAQMHDLVRASEKRETADALAVAQGSGSLALQSIDSQIAHTQGALDDLKDPGPGNSEFGLGPDEFDVAQANATAVNSRQALQAQLKEFEDERFRLTGINQKAVHRANVLATYPKLAEALGKEGAQEMVRKELNLKIGDATERALMEYYDNIDNPVTPAQTARRELLVQRGILTPATLGQEKILKQTQIQQKKAELLAARTANQRNGLKYRNEQLTSQTNAIAAMTQKQLDIQTTLQSQALTDLERQNVLADLTRTNIEIVEMTQKSETASKALLDQQAAVVEKLKGIKNPTNSQLASLRAAETTLEELQASDPSEFLKERGLNQTLRTQIELSKQRGDNVEGLQQELEKSDARLAQRERTISTTTRNAVAAQNKVVAEQKKLDIELAKNEKELAQLTKAEVDATSGFIGRVHGAKEGDGRFLHPDALFLIGGKKNAQVADETRKHLLAEHDPTKAGLTVMAARLNQLHAEDPSQSRTDLAKQLSRQFLTLQKSQVSHALQAQGKSIPSNIPVVKLSSVQIESEANRKAKEPKPVIRNLQVGKETVTAERNPQTGEFNAVTVDGVEARGPKQSQVSVNFGSPGERKQLAEGRTKMAQLGRIQSLYKPSFTGQVQGRAGAVMSSLGYISENEAEFRAEVALFGAEIRRFFAGTAQSASELKTLLDAVPAINQSDAQFQGAMAAVQKNMQRKEAEILRLLNDHGVSDPRDISKVSGKTTKQRLEELLTDGYEVQDAYSRLKFEGYSG